MGFNFQNLRDTLNSEVKFAGGLRLERPQQQAPGIVVAAPSQYSFQNLRDVLNSEVKFAGGIRLERPVNNDEKFKEAIEKLGQGDSSGLAILAELGIEYNEDKRKSHKFTYITFKYEGEEYSFKLPNSIPKPSGQKIPPRPENQQKPPKPAEHQNPPRPGNQKNPPKPGEQQPPFYSNNDAGKEVLDNGMSTTSGTRSDVNIDENGNKVVVDYLNDKKIKETVTDPEGNLLSVTEFDSNERVSNIKEYYESGKLSKESEYENGVLKQETFYNESGVKTQENFYDEQGKIKSSNHYSMGEAKFQRFYNEQGQVIKESTFLRGQVFIKEMEYNEDGTVSVITNKNERGVITSKEFMDYETNTALEEIYEPNGYKVSEQLYTIDKETLLRETSFDEQGNKTSETVYNDKTVVETKYKNGKKEEETVKDNDTGKLISVTQYDENENVISKTEYELNGCKKVIAKNADGSDVETRYDDEGNVVSTTTHNVDGTTTVAEGNVLTLYDANGKKVREIETLDDVNFRTTDYRNGVKYYEVVENKFGKKLSEKEFDAQGNLAVEREFSNGVVVLEIKYEPNGNKASKFEVDTNGNTTETTYFQGKEVSIVIKDKSGNVVSTTTYNADGTTTVVEGNVETVYDTAGSVISTTTHNADGTTTVVEGNAETTYDAAGNVISGTAHNADGTHTVIDGNIETTYDADDNVVSTTIHNADGTKTVIEGNKETIYDKDGSKLEETVSFKDDKGNPRTERSVFGSDGTALVSKTINYIDGNGNSREDVYEYDSEGNVAFVTVNDYSPDGTTTRETKYDGAWHAIYQKSYKDGVHQTTLEYTYEFTSDNTYTRVIEYTEGWGKGRKVTEYYENNKKTQVVTEYEESYKSADKETVNYDTEGHVTSKIIQIGNVATEYDASGNTLSTTTYDANGTKTVTIGNVDTLYDADGKEVSVTTRNADGSKTVVEGNKETVYDKDGKTVSITTHNADGTKAVVIGNIETLYDADGNSIRTATVNADGTKTVVKGNEEFLYSADGSLISRAETVYENGVKLEINVYDKDDNLISKTTFSTENGKDYVTTVDKDGNKLEETVSFKDDKGNPRTERSVFGSDGTTLVSKTINYIDGNGNPREDYFEYDTEGKVAFKIIKNMSKDKVYSYETKYDALGQAVYQITNKDGEYLHTAEFSYKTTGDNTYTRVINYTDGTLKGRKVTEYYENNKKTKAVYEYAEETNKGNKETIYYENGVKTLSEYVYAKGDKSTTYYENGVKTKNVYVYKNGDKKTTFYDSKGDKPVKSFFFTASNGTVKTTLYDSNGKAMKSARERLGKEVTTLKHSGVSVEVFLYEIYDALCDKYNKTAISVWAFFKTYKWTGRELVNIKGGAQSVEFMDMAQVGYNGTPKNATKITDYKTNPKTSDLAGYLTDKLNSQIVEPYGYDLDKIKGYYFNSNSDVAQKIAANSEFKAFINANKEKLRAGYTATSEKDAMKSKFTSGELYYAFSQYNIVKSWVDDKGKLHVLVADTYDFNKSATDVLNRCGAAAMEDGKIVPFYTLVEVVV